MFKAQWSWGGLLDTFSQEAASVDYSLTMGELQMEFWQTQICQHCSHSQEPFKFTVLHLIQYLANSAWLKNQCWFFYFISQRLEVKMSKEKMVNTLGWAGESGNHSWWGMSHCYENCCANHFFAHTCPRTFLCTSEVGPGCIKAHKSKWWQGLI